MKKEVGKIESVLINAIGTVDYTKFQQGITLAERERLLTAENALHAALDALRKISGEATKNLCRPVIAILEEPIEVKVFDPTCVGK